MTNMIEIDEIRQELAQLRRAANRQRITTGVVVGLALFATLASFATGDRLNLNEVTARRFILVDEHGKERGRLEVNDRGGALLALRGTADLEKPDLIIGTDELSRGIWIGSEVEATYQPVSDVIAPHFVREDSSFGITSMTYAGVQRMRSLLAERGDADMAVPVVHLTVGSLDGDGTYIRMMKTSHQQSFLEIMRNNRNSPHDPNEALGVLIAAMDNAGQGSVALLEKGVERAALGAATSRPGLRSASRPTNSLILRDANGRVTDSRPR